MADGNLESETYEIYWTRDESVHNNSGPEPVIHSFAPGVDKPDNKRINRKMLSEVPRRLAANDRPERDAWEGREGTPSATRQNRSRADDSRRATKTTDEVEASKVQDKPSLKDLRPEDKKRVANLIRELAKVGEEKEVIVQQLNVERRSYEDRVEKLQAQMTAIIRERELTQKQYLECQKLLAEYQSQLATEQEKLAASFHLSPSPQKVQTPRQLGPAKHKIAPTAKNKSFTGTANHITTPATPGHHQDEYHNAPQRNGFQYPAARPVEPSTQQHQSPRTHPPYHSPSDVEFNPLLASTNQPMQHQYDPATNGEPTMYVSYGNKQNSGGYILRPGFNLNESINLPPNVRFPNDSQETLASRTQSGDFQPLQPEFDRESQGSQSQDYVGSLQNQDYIPQVEGRLFHGGGQEDRNQTSFHPPGQWNHPQDSHTHLSKVPPPAQVPVHQTSAEHRQAVLEKQRQQLRAEQAWLQQKLRDQETMLVQKQRQLKQHQLNQLDREWQRDYKTAWNPSQHEWRIPHITKRIDQDWEQPQTFNESVNEAPSGSENDDDNIVASTNFPPEGFHNASPPRQTLEDTLRRLTLTRDSYSEKDHSWDARRARGVAMTAGQQNTSGGSGGSRGKLEGYASMYPGSQVARHQIQASTSKSGFSHPTAVDQSTSPLYQDQSTSPTDRPSRSATLRSPDRKRHSLSPGRVNRTPAPQQSWAREAGGSRQEERYQERRTVSLPRSPKPQSRETSMRKSKVTYLSDLIAEMESPRPPSSTSHLRPASTTHNVSATGRGYSTTPDLFGDEVTDTEAEVEETQILEDVFFL